MIDQILQTQVSVVGLLVYGTIGVASLFALKKLYAYSKNVSFRPFVGGTTALLGLILSGASIGEIYSPIKDKPAPVAVKVDSNLQSTVKDMNQDINHAVANLAYEEPAIVSGDPAPYIRRYVPTQIAGGLIGLGLGLMGIGSLTTLRGWYGESVKKGMEGARTL